MMPPQLNLELSAAKDPPKVKCDQNKIRRSGEDIFIIDNRLAYVLLSSIDRNPDRGYRPLGLFLIPEDNGAYCAIDNNGGHAWTEDFHNRECAVKWLVGGYQDYDTYLKYNRNKPEFRRIFGERRLFSESSGAV